MDENAFKETMINTIRFDSKFKEYKKTLLPIINRIKVVSIPQWSFAVRSGQRWENVEIRVPVPLIDTANELENDITTLVGYVYEETEEYALNDVLIKPLIEKTEEYVSNDVAFSEIQNVLIQGIVDAKYLLWISVAWFSNDVFYEELLKKKKQGINIRIIVSDEECNNKLFLKLEKEFDCIKIPRYGNWGRNLMHHKFCIVDMEYVMHGSYNWTVAANYNGETLETSVDRELVKKFADQFIKMYVNGTNTSSVFYD